MKHPEDKVRCVECAKWVDRKAGWPIARFEPITFDEVLAGKVPRNSIRGFHCSAQCRQQALQRFTDTERF